MDFNVVHQDNRKIKILTTKPTMWYVNFTNDENIAFSQLALQILYAAQLYMRHG